MKATLTASPTPLPPPQRAASKVTFPAYWANTCCSHPLHFDAELEPVDALGVKRAAVRKLQQELGIPPEDVPLSCFHFVTRIHYMAPANDPENLWAEHEIDHILIAVPPTMPRLAPNPNEVDSVRAFTPTEMAQWVHASETDGTLVAPWFKCMERTMLYRWWATLAGGDLAPIVELHTIHRFGTPPYTLPPHADVMRDAKAAEAAVDAHAARDPDSRGVPALATRLTQAHFKSIPAGAGAGAAAAAPGAVQAPTEALGDEGKKQGAYGKVVTHSEGALSQLMHVDEVWAAVLYKTGLSASAKVTPLNAATATPAAMWCEDMLGRVSRSFAMVIRQLSPRLRSSIAVFYLVLRGLDTVEDDMTAFADGRTAEKLRHLRDFHTYLQDPSWCMQGVGQGDEATLLEEFGQVAATFAELPPGDQDVIADICAKMGAGMARFADRDLLEGTEDLAEYNLYCHFVAGLVGEGLTRLFVSSGAEDAALAADLAVANHMGLFLQKTNIIRDYLEDLVEGRAFWPRSVWSRYAPKLAALRGTGGPSAAAVPPGYTPGSAGSPEDPHVPAEGALGCLNHLIADAMCHVPHCLAYLAALQADDVFRFCAIPQIMAIATLDKLTSNTEVFTGVVKIRKGQAVSLIQAASNRHSVYGIFLHHLRSIMGKLAAHISATPGAASTPVFANAMQAAAASEAWVVARLPHGALTALFDGRVVAGVAVVLAALLRTLNERSRAWGGYVPRLTDSFDVLLLAAAVVCVLYIIAFTGVPLVMWSAAAAEEEEAAGAKGIALSAPSPKAPTPPKYQVPTSEETFPRSSTQREGGALSSPPRGLRTRRGGMAE